MFGPGKDVSMHVCLHICCVDNAAHHIGALCSSTCSLTHTVVSQLVLLHAHHHR